MARSINASDGSTRAPRLEVFQATWAMRDLPGAGWPSNLVQMLGRVSEAGFAGVFHWVATDADFEVIEGIRRAGLLAGCGFPDLPGVPVTGLAARARDAGATFANAQVHDSFVVDGEALQRVGRLYDEFDAASLPLFIETHRGTITQDLIRTVAYSQESPRMRFTLDASHFVVAGEVIQPAASPQFQELLAEIIARSSSVHARVSNGEQVQVDIGDGSGPLVEPFVGWWTAAYRQWLAGAHEGEYFPFVCELGPALYSITAPAGGEISDRWAQALVLKGIGERIAGAVTA